MHPGTPLNVAIIAQAGRLGYQALLSAASIRAFHSRGEVRISICIPSYTDLWRSDPRVEDPELLQAYVRHDCDVVYFNNADFGSAYPHSNKFYAILSLPAGEKFLFLDSDTIVVEQMREENFNFLQPSLRPAKVHWPVNGQNAHSAGEIWRSLYEMFGLDVSKYVDADQKESSPQAYPYYNAALIYYADAHAFGHIILDMAKRVWRETPPAVVGQPLKPWLDQIVLPLTLAKLGVPRRKRVDPIRQSITHYQSPVYLMTRHVRGYARFVELCKDTALAEVLKRDKAFGFYMSEDGKQILDAAHSEFLQSSAKGDYKALKEIVRRRAPTIR